MRAALRLRRAAPLATGHARHLCGGHEMAERLRNAHMILGVEAGTPKQKLKMAFWAKAKECHPDVVGGEREKASRSKRKGAVVQSTAGGAALLDDDANGAPSVDQFVEIQAAFDLLMEALESGEDGAKPRRRNKPGARQKTLGEVLCERLRDEPPAWADVWAELKQSRLDVTTAMIDGLLKACGKSGGGLHDAIGMLRDASASGMMHQPVRNQALGSLLNLAIELDWDVDAAVNEINDVDRESPEVIAAIGAVYCSGTRSPF